MSEILVAYNAQAQGIAGFFESAHVNLGSVTKQLLRLRGREAELEAASSRTRYWRRKIPMEASPLYTTT